MPVRKIPKNHLIVTGGFSSQKSDRMIGFESLLEKDYMLLLDFDPTVANYEEQPIRIPVPKVPQGYVIDLKVNYHSRPTELVEIKTQSDLDKHAQKYAPKFEAAHIYCAERGWRFVIQTEQDIRTPRLSNLKFLRRYRTVQPEVQQREAVLRCMAQSGGQSTSDELLDQLGPNQREDWLPVLWSMLLRGDLIADMDTLLPPNVPLRLKGGAT